MLCSDRVTLLRVFEVGHARHVPGLPRMQPPSPKPSPDCCKCWLVLRLKGNFVIKACGRASNPCFSGRLGVWSRWCWRLDETQCHKPSLGSAWLVQTSNILHPELFRSMDLVAFQTQNRNVLATQFPKSHAPPDGSTQIAVFNRKLQLDTLRFGSQLPKSHWPLSFSAYKSQRFKLQRLQDANTTTSQTLALYKSQRFSATKNMESNTPKNLAEGARGSSVLVVQQNSQFGTSMRESVPICHFGV